MQLLICFAASYLSASSHSIAVDPATSNLVISAGEGGGVIELTSTTSVGAIPDIETAISQGIRDLSDKIDKGIAATDTKVGLLADDVALKIDSLTVDLKVETVADAVTVVAGKVDALALKMETLGDARHETLVDSIAAIKVTADAAAAANTGLDERVTRELQAVTDTLDALGTATAALANSFHGSLVGFPASSCGAIREKQAGAADGTYYLKSGREVFRAECKTNGKDKFVSAGGNGKTQASAAAGCSGNSLVGGNTDDTKWIDPDEDAENTDNAKKKSCITDMPSWDNDNCNPPEGTGAIASSYRADQKPCKAFDNNDDPDGKKGGGDFWQTAHVGQAGAWLGWNFGKKTKVKIMSFLVDNNYTPRVFQRILLEGSDDGSVWELIYDTTRISWTNHQQEKIFDVGDNWKEKKSYHMVRIFNKEYDSSGEHALIGKLKFMGTSEAV